MITFLSSPKPFSGPAGVIQMNAIRSWQLVHPEAEIILYGDSGGTAEACRELGAKHVTEISCSPSGVPYFNSIADHAEQNGKYDLQVYLNCDILLSGVLEVMELIKFSKFLLIGERIDLDESVFIDLSEADCEKKLMIMAKEGRIHPHGPTGIDYFAFRRGLWKELSPVIIGRAGYDNALLAHCIRNRVPIVDGSFSILALHQFHDYGHVAGGKVTIFRGAEALQNFDAAGGKHSATLVSDAEYVIRGGEIIHYPCRGDRLRHFELTCRYSYGLSTLALIVRALWRLLESVNLVGRRELDFAKLLSRS